jgi:multiple sugar transport system substrate-binding protein
MNPTGPHAPRHAGEAEGAGEPGGRHTHATPSTRTPTRRRLLAAAPGLLALAGALPAAACGAGSGGATAELPKPATGPVTLEFLNFWGPVRDPLLEKVWAEFKKTHPNVTIQNSFAAGSAGVLQKFRTTAAAGSPPDVVMNNREFLPALAEEGTLEALEPYMAAAKVTPGQFVDLDIKMCQWTGKTYGLPVLTAGANGITHYNATHLREAGLSPDRLPATWPDYQAHARRLTNGARWGGNIRGGITGFLGYLLPHKGRYVSEDGRRLLFGDALGLDVMTLVGQFFEPLGGLAAFQEWQRGQQSGEANTPFFVQTLSMDLTGGDWYPYQIRQFAPQLDYRVAVAPGFPGDRQQSVGRTGLSYQLPKGVKHPREAWELLAFMTARKEGTLSFAQQQGRASARKEDNRDQGYAGVPNWPVIVKMVEEATAVQFTPVEQEIATALNTAVTNVQQKKQSPKEALDQALQTGQAALDQYWSTRKR